MSNLLYCAKHGRSWLKSVRETCTACDKEQAILDEIENIQARFYGWKLHEQQELDFAWLIKTLKERMRGSN